MRKLLFLIFLCSVSVCYASEYPYWIEDDGGNYSLWIKVNVSAGGSKILYIDKVEGYSPNGDEVFEFFDDFETNDGWITDTLGTTYFGVDGTWLKIYDKDSTYHYAYRDIGLQPGCVVEYKWKIPSASQVSVVNHYLQDSSFSGTDQTDVHMGGEGKGLSTNVEEIWYTASGIAYPLSNNSVYKTVIRIAPDLTTTKTTYEIGNESNSVTITTTNTKNLGPYWKFRMGVGNSYTCDFYVDYLLVRKYADLEPTVTVEQINSDVWKITITNPNNYNLTDYQIDIPLPNELITSKNESLYIDYNPPLPLSNIYILNNQSTEISGIIYDINSVGYCPNKQLVDAAGNVYNWMTQNGRKVYVEIPDTLAIPSGTVLGLEFNDTDYTPVSLDTTNAQWVDMVFSTIPIVLGEEDSSNIAQHYITVNLDTKTIKSTVVLTDGTFDVKTYDFTNEYNTIYNEGFNAVDFTEHTSTLDGLTITSTATISNNKTSSITKELTQKDAELLYAAIQSFYSDFKGLWIKIGDLEYLFPIISREKQPDLNITKNVAINGSLEYEVLGNPLNKWTFEVYVDDYSKIAALEQLLQNPAAYVKFDEIGEYKQCLITDISYSRITSGKYNASIELTIL